MSHPGNDSDSRISVNLAGDPNVSVTQCATCSMDAERGINPRTELLAQGVQRLVRIDPLLSQPTRELLEILLATVVKVSDLRFRLPGRLNDKLSRGL